MMLIEAGVSSTGASEKPPTLARSAAIGLVPVTTTSGIAWPLFCAEAPRENACITA
jgi:hypothetical protein